MTARATWAAALTITLAVPAGAQELRETPNYFASAVFDLSMAQALARSCSAVSLDPVLAAKRSEALLVRLTEDGFTTTAPHEEMDDPNAAIRALQTDFVARYAIDEPSEDEVCAIAEAEMADASGIGALLVSVSGG